MYFSKSKCELNKSEPSLLCKNEAYSRRYMSDYYGRNSYWGVQFYMKGCGGLHINGLFPLPRSESLIFDIKNRQDQ